VKKPILTVLVCVPLIAFAALLVRERGVELKLQADAAKLGAITGGTGEPEAATPQPGFLYGRISGRDGETYEGRLRFGGDQEAFWGDYFNGAKSENPWVAMVPPEQLPKSRRAAGVFGIVIHDREEPIDTDRRFMARFGDITRIEAHGRDVRVTLKSGTAFDLNRFDASDFDDGVRVWDGKRGVKDLDSVRITSIELIPVAAPIAAAGRLHGTVHTSHGDFTGFVQWDREECVGSDSLDGNTKGGDLHLRFDTIRSIERQSIDSSKVVLLDGHEFVLSGTNDVGRGHRGVYVDDPRYGRVLVNWDAFTRVEFSPAGSGPGYDEFPPGVPLKGSVTTKDGRRLAGRLVYDLDESETTETFDAPSNGVDYTIPFGLLASIVRPSTVTLKSGETLQLETRADLGENNAGMLVFAPGAEKPDYVPWKDVERVDLD
jgi:hypothetical protein